MGIYLPTAAVGNGRVLATLGSAGEIMTFFYPRIDFAQNIHECLPALYLGEPGHGLFTWTFEPRFQRSQHYLPQTNVLTTELKLAMPPLTLTFQDFCPPDTDALVRTVTVRNLGNGPLRGAFLHYFDLNLGEVALKQAVRYAEDEGCILQYFRDVVLAVGGTRPDMWRCGKSIDQQSPGSAKSDMYDGHLNGQPEDIGQVDFAVGYHLQLGPGQEREIQILISAAQSSQRSSQQFRELREHGVPKLLDATTQQNRRWLVQRRTVSVSDKLEAAYQRALLALSILYDTHENCFIAAPEFDPHYLRCGGYGYCWPRDAAVAAIALHRAGFSDYLEGQARWLTRTQLPSGRWAQRYWTDGKMAASWSLREDFHQLDQSASAVHLLATYLLTTPKKGQVAGTQDCWEALQHGAEALVASVGDDGWHYPACDLWETYRGRFVYTEAAIYAALRTAAVCAKAAGHQPRAQQWGAVAERVQQAVIAAYRDGYFPRGRNSGEDSIVDSSTLGVVVPFGLLQVDNPDHREMIESNLETIQRRLTTQLNDGEGIRRYEGDGYLGGTIGCVNTLWAAWVGLRLAQADKNNSTRCEEYKQQAIAYINFALEHATATGLLPELIGTQSDTPYWAAPHSWASALLVECVLALDALELPTGNKLERLG